MDVSKMCSKCKIEKRLSEFYEDKCQKSGYYPSCKSCKKIKNKEVARKYSLLTTREEKDKKVCSRCKIEKNVLEYVKNRYQKDGFAGECKQCSHKRYTAHNIIKHLEENIK